jgi:hypothetical protein
MSAKRCPKIILEGTRLTLKTELAFTLNEHPRIVGPRKYRYHSPLISAEWGAFTNFPWGRGPINFQPEEEALAMETYHAWARLFRGIIPGLSTGFISRPEPISCKLMAGIIPFVGWSKGYLH